MAIKPSVTSSGPSPPWSLSVLPSFLRQSWLAPKRERKKKRRKGGGREQHQKIRGLSFLLAFWGIALLAIARFIFPEAPLKGSNEA